MSKGWKSPASTKPQEPPSGGSSVKSAAAPAQPELPVERELLGETVIVKTPQPIGGASEHAALVTRAHDNGVVDVMLMPSSGESYRIHDVQPASSGASLHWRHRRGW